MSTTIADRIIDRLLGGDGQRRETRLGVDRFALIERIAIRQGPTPAEVTE